MLRSALRTAWQAPIVQRALPDGAALALAARRPMAEELPPDRALAAFAVVLADTPLAGREEEIAARARRNLRRSEAVMRRPAMVRAGRVVGAGPLEALIASPRGVLTATGHLTTSFLRIAALGAAYDNSHIVVGDFLMAPDPGARNRGRRALLEQYGVSLIAASGSFGRARELLAQGEHCHLAFDVAGEHAVTFLGKRTLLRSGIAQLALLTDSPILGGYSLLVGDRLETRFLAPIDPREVTDPVAILQAIADQLTPAFLAHPELLHPYLAMLWAPDLLDAQDL